MANLVAATIEVTGPAEDLERVRAAIAACATELREGVVSLKKYRLDWGKWEVEFPEWGDCTPLGRLESRYEARDDGLPVRIADGVLIIETETNETPPVGFAERLGELFPSLEITGRSLELTNSILERWRSRGGQTELLERRESAFIGEEIVEWEIDDHVWKWTNERNADIRMLQSFLAIGIVDGAIEEDLLTACRLAYEALAFPHDTLRAEANSYAYDLARIIAEYRNALIRKHEASAPEENTEMMVEDLLDELRSIGEPAAGLRAHTGPAGDAESQEGTEP